MDQLFRNDVYQVHLPMFEGPFDLLLFFIERDELDIHDIPISKITNDFLDYIHSLEAMNIEIASEFILVAATLMKIKAKMLLPRPVIKEDGTVEDPRTELVTRLLEYKRYKETLAQFELMEDDRSKMFARGYTQSEEKILMESEFPEEELMGLDLYALMKAFRRVMSRQQDRLEEPKHIIQKYPYTMDAVKKSLINELSTRKRLDFMSYVMENPEKIFLVFTFLAILELVNQQSIKIVVGEGFNNFWLSSAA